MPDHEEKLWDVPTPLPPHCPSRLASHRGLQSVSGVTAIAEAVFRDLLQQLTANPGLPPCYYLALQGRNPDVALQRQLQALVPSIQPRSHCRVSARTGVTDRATGVAGVILEVTSLLWIHETAVEVVGGYYATPWHAAALRNRVEYDGVQWIITTARELWRVNPCGGLPKGRW